MSDEDNISDLERKVRVYQDRFLAGDGAAVHIVWDLVYATMVRRAARKLDLDYEQARDVATDAMLYVQGRGNGEKVESLMALFNQSLAWHIGKAKYSNEQGDREFCASDFDFLVEDDYSGEEDEDGDSDPLVVLETTRMREGYVPHAYLTSVTLTTPEDIVLAENLREFLERVAVEACGAEAWSIYHAVVVQEKTQAEIAETHDMSQQRVSQLVREVGEALRAALLAAA